MPFKPGQSGNKKGRPPGIPDKRSRLRRQFEEGSVDLIRKIKREALGGDIQAQKLWLERICSPLRAESSPVKLSINPDSRPSEQGKSLIKALNDGRLTIDDLHAVMRMLESYTSVIDKSETEDRLSVLEKEIKRYYGKKKSN